MVVIRTGKLVLDDDFPVVVDDFGEDIDVVFSNWFLSFNQFDIEINRVL